MAAPISLAARVRVKWSTEPSWPQRDTSCKGHVEITQPILTCKDLKEVRDQPGRPEQSVFQAEESKPRADRWWKYSMKIKDQMAGVEMGRGRGQET